MNDILIQAVVSEPFSLIWEKSEFDGNIPPNTLLAKTLFSTISPGTELGVFTGQYPPRKDSRYPFQPGYAASGIVVQTGDGVSLFQKGDQIYFPGQHANYCLVIDPDHSAVKLKKGMDLQLAPFARFCQIAYSAVVCLENKLITNNQILVVGLGVIGNITGQLFKLAGADVYGVDSHENRCRLAENNGFCRACHPDDTDNYLLEKYPIIIDTTGNPKMIEYSLQNCSKYGSVVVLGSPRYPVSLDVYSLIHKPCRSIIGANEGWILNELRGKVSSDMLDLIMTDKIKINNLISKILPASELESAYKLLLNKDHYVDILLDWTQ